MNDSKIAWNNQTIQQSARFIVLIVLATLLIPWMVEHSVGIQWLESATAKIALGGLSAMGTRGTLNDSIEPVQLQIQGKLILISELCTGLLEFAILAGAIIATKEIKRKKRLYGVVGALVGVFVFNQIRIVASAMQLLTTSEEIADLTHNVLFRIFLFLVIAGMYWFWLNWALDKKKGSNRAFFNLQE